MSQDFPDRKKWLAIRYTPRDLHLGHVFFSGGTYVRPRGTAEDRRLAWYQRQCNANARGERAKRREAAPT